MDIDYDETLVLLKSPMFATDHVAIKHPEVNVPYDADEIDAMHDEPEAILCSEDVRILSLTYIHIYTHIHMDRYKLVLYIMYIYVYIPLACIYLYIIVDVSIVILIFVYL